MNFLVPAHYLPFPYGAAGRIARVCEVVRHERFPEGISCPLCGGRSIHRWGSFRSRQRYRCRDCRRTFSDFTGTAFARCRSPDKLMAMLDCIREGCSVRASAERVGVHPSTAFRWRHRLLETLRVAPRPRLQGIVEITEFKYPDCRKGSRRLDRPPRRRATPDYVASADRVYVVVARNRRHQAFAASAGPGLPAVSALERILLPVLGPGARLCAFRGGAYRLLAARHGFQDCSPWYRPRGPAARFLHIRNVTGFRMRLREWLKRFRGVAARYLDRYLAWYAFLERAPGFAPLARATLLASAWS